MKVRKKIISMLVVDTPGVLTRVTSLFGKRSYNIETLTISHTNFPNITRMTAVVSVDDDMLEQMILQIKKLLEVKELKTLEFSNCIARELLLVKVAATTEAERHEIKEISSIYNAIILELSYDNIILQMTDKESRIDSLLSALSKFTLIEVCRTGITALDN